MVVGMLPIHTSFVICLFIYSLSSLGKDRLRRRFEIVELEVRGFTITNLVSFKCSSF
jgi:hypothetical protein